MQNALYLDFMLIFDRKLGNIENSNLFIFCLETKNRREAWFYINKSCMVTFQEEHLVETNTEHNEKICKHNYSQSNNLSEEVFCLKNYIFLTSPFALLPNFSSKFFVLTPISVSKSVIFLVNLSLDHTSQP